MRILKLIAALGLIVCTLPIYAQVRVWEGTLAIPTYEEGLPDPNPPFDQFTTNRFNYPYTLRNNLTGRRVEKTWRAIYLENEYLKCSVLPDIGGHLYTCIDKISGKSMFYANPSIKKAAIGYRGAWAAFGIEFNFPVSHNWVTLSPVNYAYAQHDDGTASVTVGDVDRVYGMEWMVELVLRPGSTVLEQRVTLSNRSDSRHRFYWWNNAAVEAWDDSQIEYPMRFAATHGFTEIHPWPVDRDGIDYSILGNHKNGPVSMFTHGSREDFMGVWNPHTNTGTVHFAPYESVPAKKIWSWGVDADGLDWRRALSDNNSGYLEVQAGLFRNQETYAFLEPQQVIQFSEYWMPVRQIGGISRANLIGVASLIRRNNSLVVGFNANREIPRAHVQVVSGKDLVLDDKVDLRPETAWLREIPIHDPHAKYTVEIKDAQGLSLLRQTEGEYDFIPQSEIQLGPQPSFRIPDTKHRSYDDWIEFGKEEELNGRLLSALDAYKQTLTKFPNSFIAQKAAGRLSAALLRFDEAKDLLEGVHLRDTTDAEISYYLGLAYEGLSDDLRAKAAFEGAERLPTMHSAASLKLGELLARSGDLLGAENHLKEAVRSAPNDARAHEDLVAIETAIGETQQAKTLAQQSVTRFPLSYFLREEIGDPSLHQLANGANRILNVAAQYIQLGLYQKALTVLTRDYPQPTADEVEPGSVDPQHHPLIAYFRGYCLQKLGQSSLADYLAASKLSTSYVFPSTATEITVLHSALRANPSDATAHYFAGTFYFSKGLADRALREWSIAEKDNSQLPVLSASTGLAELHIKNDPEKALSAFERGISSDRENIAVYMGMDQALSLLERPAKERADALAKYPHLDSAAPALIFELILNRAEAGDFEAANKLFHKRFFPREEGGTNVRQVWIEVQLQRVVALAKAGKCDDALAGAQRLGSEVPELAFTHDGLDSILQSSRTHYLLATAYAACGNPEMSGSKFKAAVGGTAPDQIHWSWLAAQKLPGFMQENWQDRLNAAFDQAAARSETSQYPSWWMYNAGLLAQDLGRTDEASFRFHQALLLPDRMLAYHFTRLARTVKAVQR
jgi:tetratricopeptide (TPR) repeat protein